MNGDLFLTLIIVNRDMNGDLFLTLIIVNRDINRSLIGLAQGPIL